MAMAEEGMIEAEVKTTSPTPTNMVVGLTEGTEGTLSPPYPPHQGQIQHMLPGMHSMGICLLRTIPSSHNIKVSRLSTRKGILIFNIPPVLKKRLSMKFM